MHGQARLDVLMAGADFDNPSAVKALCTLDANLGNLSFVLKESNPRWTTGYLQVSDRAVTVL